MNVGKVPEGLAEGPIDRDGHNLRNFTVLMYTYDVAM